MRRINNLIIILMSASALVAEAYSQDNQKLAQTGFKFLSVISDARAAAMGEAMTSLQTKSSAMFFNPAGMAEMTNLLDISGSTNQWIADINHYTFSLAVNPSDGKYGVFGLSLQSVDYGNFYGTRVNSGIELGYDDTGIFTLSSIAVGFGYAKKLTERFSVGGHIRWVQQDLGESIIPVITAIDTTEKAVSNKLSPLVFDFGTIYLTGFKSLAFGVSIRNYSREVKYVEEGFQAPLVFNIGVSMNVFDFFEDLPLNQKLIVSIDASHHRDYPEQIKVGFDYQILEILSLRGGYISSSDENGISFGLGLSQFGFSLDYAYTPYGIFDKVQRLTGRFSL